jgi:hypothetical protein
MAQLTVFPRSVVNHPAAALGLAWTGPVLFAAVWALSIAGVLPFGVLELALLGALLGLVPASLGFAGDGADELTPPIMRGWRRALLTLHPLAGVIALAAMLLPEGRVAGALSLVWLAYGVALSLFGALRFFGRADRMSAAELCVDAGFAYSIVGAIAFVTARYGVDFLGYYAPFPALTAMHFHFAGMFLPVIAGLTGRALSARFRQPFAIAAAGLIGGSALVGFGILWSPALELASVIALALSAWLLAGLVLAGVVPNSDGWARKLALSASAAVLFVSMPLAVLYNIGEYIGAPLITIPQMIDTHGMLNALGVGLLGALGWLWSRRDVSPRVHPDLELIERTRALPLNYRIADGERGMTVHTFERVLGHDPDGAMFERAGDHLMRYTVYPAHVISSVSDFKREARRARVGDRMVVRLHLLHLFGLPMLHKRGLVEVVNIVDAPNIKRMTYCTTGYHIARGACTATLTWRDDGMVLLNLRSVERPLIDVLRLPGVNAIFRAFLDRALCKGLGNMFAVALAGKGD